ncbi:hypothetical protein EVAR_28343_1 [Eumeta japonica]|uniref:Uncharacterized protein n=1 Tax=Eumeta variegata TaxID=151549 RepID=A0A4C1VB06_EUMVA|nr:hypothetical protein EVAR_28343_1 [Eumeta japonica]
MVSAGRRGSVALVVMHATSPPLRQRSAGACPPLQLQLPQLTRGHRSDGGGSVVESVASEEEKAIFKRLLSELKYPECYRSALATFRSVHTPTSRHALSRLCHELAALRPRRTGVDDLRQLEDITPDDFIVRCLWHSSHAQASLSSSSSVRLRRAGAKTMSFALQPLYISYDTGQWYSVFNRHYQSEQDV